MNRFGANWHKGSTGPGHVTINFGGHEIKGQGHMRTKRSQKSLSVNYLKNYPTKF